MTSNWGLVLLLLVFDAWLLARLILPWIGLTFCCTPSGTTCSGNRIFSKAKNSDAKWCLSIADKPETAHLASPALGCVQELALVALAVNYSFCPGYRTKNFLFFWVLTFNFTFFTVSSLNSKTFLFTSENYFSSSTQPLKIAISLAFLRHFLNIETSLISMKGNFNV